MTTWTGADLHQDDKGRFTSRSWGDRGDGTNDWFGYFKTRAYGATDLMKREDDAHASLDTGIAVLAVRRDTADVGSGAAGDYSTFNVDANGRLYTQIGAEKAEDAAHTSGDSGVPALAVRRDTAAVGSGTAGDYSTFNVDAEGRLYTRAKRDSDDDPSISATTALATNLVVKASAGTLFQITGYSTTAQFLQVHDASSLPADTAVPEIVIPIAANEPFVLALPGHACGTGIVICNSTTGPTKNIGAADTWITAHYV